MHADTVVALASAAVAAIIAVTVPWMTFRLALRQDHVRWIREQRSQLYVDMLTEAGAEQDWLEYRLAPEEVRETAHRWYTDNRLPPLERARLAARGTIFGSRTVNHLFNQIGTEAFSATVLARGEPEAVRITARVRVAGIVADLNQAVRRELGTDRVSLNGGPPPDSPLGGAGRQAYSAATFPPFDDEDPGAAGEPAPETAPDAGQSVHDHWSQLRATRRMEPHRRCQRRSRRDPDHRQPRRSHPLTATPLGYTVVNSGPRPDGTTEVIVADLYSPAWETPLASPGHAHEDAMIIRTHKAGRTTWKRADADPLPFRYIREIHNLS